jgi:hypothetical protein
MHSHSPEHPHHPLTRARLPARRTLVAELRPAPTRHMVTPLHALHHTPTPHARLPPLRLRQRAQLRRARVRRTPLAAVRRLPAPHAHRVPARGAREGGGARPPTTTGAFRRCGPEERGAGGLRAVEAVGRGDAELGVLLREGGAERGGEEGVDGAGRDRLFAAAEWEVRLVPCELFDEGDDAVGAVVVVAGGLQGIAVL